MARFTIHILVPILLQLLLAISEASRPVAVTSSSQSLDHFDSLPASTKFRSRSLLNSDSQSESHGGKNGGEKNNSDNNNNKDDGQKNNGDQNNKDDGGEKNGGGKSNTPSPWYSSTPSTPFTSPSPPATKPSTPAPSTPTSPTPSPPTPKPSPSGSSSAPKKAKCKDKYSQCYDTEYVCPSSCPNGCEVDCATCKPICKCDRPGTVCQDPRFVGGDGVTFYFHGTKDNNFCLVSDSNPHINAHFIGKRNQNMTRDFTWVQSIAILFNKYQLFLGALKTSTWDDSVDRLSLPCSTLLLSREVKSYVVFANLRSWEVNKNKREGSVWLSIRSETK